jgi:hypothetical protein
VFRAGFSQLRCDQQEIAGQDTLRLNLDAFITALSLCAGCPFTVADTRAMTACQLLGALKLNGPRATPMFPTHLCSARQRHGTPCPTREHAYDAPRLRIYRFGNPSLNRILNQRASKGQRAERRNSVPDGLFVNSITDCGERVLRLHVQHELRGMHKVRSLEPIS